MYSVFMQRLQKKAFPLPLYENSGNIFNINVINRMKNFQPMSVTYINPHGDGPFNFMTQAMTQ